MDTKRAAYVSGSAHSPAKTPTGIDLIRNPSLPRRLLPSDGLPDRARLNIYCKPKYLGILVQLLKGSETWSSFLASQFWKLFELHVARCFHSAKLIQEPQKRFSTWKKLSLALIVIVDGVAVCSNKKAGRVTGRFIEMLHDIEFFMNYPWGRVSFEATIGRFGPSLLDKDPIEDLKTRFSQRSSCCYGFPLSLQLQVLNYIPALCSRIKDPADFRNFIQRPTVDLSRTILLRETDVLDVEYNPNVSQIFTFKLPYMFQSIISNSSVVS